MSPLPPTSSAGGDDGDDDGNDDADALSDGTSEGVRNTQPAAMHSANIGIVASNRIVNLLASQSRDGCTVAMQRRCHAPPRRRRPQGGAGAARQGRLRDGAMRLRDCAIARLRDGIARLRDYRQCSGRRS